MKKYKGEHPVFQKMVGFIWVSFAVSACVLHMATLAQSAILFIMGLGGIIIGESRIKETNTEDFDNFLL